MMKGWACCVLICHQQKRTFGGWRTSSKDFTHFRVLYDVLRSSRNVKIRDLELCELRQD